MTANKCPACGGSGRVGALVTCGPCHGSGIEPRAEKTAETDQGASPSTDEKQTASQTARDREAGQPSCPAEAPTEPGASPEPHEWCESPGFASHKLGDVPLCFRCRVYRLGLARGREEERAAVPHTCPFCRCGLRAPVQGSNDRPRGAAGSVPGSVSWDEHVAAWTAYASRYPGQSADRMAERGGFSYGELEMFLGRAPSTWLPDGNEEALKAAWDRHRKPKEGT